MSLGLFLMDEKNEMPKKYFIAVLLAVVLFSLSSPIIKLLVEEGGEYGLMHAGSISFCNVLFVGNLCAGIIVLFVFGAKKIFKELQTIGLNAKLWLLLSSIFAFLYPSLIFFALESTTVTNIVLLSRFESIFYVILAWIFFQKKLNKEEMIGYGIIGIGVVMLVLIGEMFMIMKGDYFVITAALIYAISLYVSRQCLRLVSLGLFLFIRNLFSAIIFFCLAIYLFGFEHFSEAFVGELWILMLIYALLIIVLGQYLWYSSGKHVKPKRITHLLMLSPLITLFFAFFLLGEVPNWQEGIAIGIILLGVIISKLNTGHEEHVVVADKSISG